MSNFNRQRNKFVNKEIRVQEGKKDKVDPKSEPLTLISPPRGSSM